VESVVGYRLGARRAIVISRHVAIAIVVDGIIVSDLLLPVGISLPSDPAPVVAGPGKRNPGNLSRWIAILSG
jgi:hypothetical protein